MFERTPCETCDFVHMDTRKKHPYQWLCVKFRRLEGLSAIAPTVWVKVEPYNRCDNINVGHCPLYERRRDGQKELIDRDRKPELKRKPENART